MSFHSRLDSYSSLVFLPFYVDILVVPTAETTATSRAVCLQKQPGGEPISLHFVYIFCSSLEDYSPRFLPVVTVTDTPVLVTAKF